ncbi:MAG: S8 family serine peptidase [candidate division KSB1 bacterium]|jgi:subtilisin family serine protease|nr:S8 family serine peptidase [candidate division KSB1 bacterium]
MRLKVTFLLIILMFAVVTQATAMDDTIDVYPGVIVVKFKAMSSELSMEKAGSSTGLASVDQILSTFNADEMRKYFPAEEKPANEDMVDLSTIYRVQFDESIDPNVIAADFTKLDNVEYAEPLYVHKLAYTPNDPLFVNQGYLAVIQAADAWNIVRGDGSVIIGVVDSGVDWDHPDLVQNIWQNLAEDADGDGHTIEFIDGKWELDPGDLNGVDDDLNSFRDDLIGWDFVGPNSSFQISDNNPDPVNGSSHGTHVAGLAAAVSDNGTGIASVSYHVRLMVTKHGIDAPGSRSVFNAYDGVKYMIDNGADIINCSWGGSQYSSFARDIINQAYQKGVIVVAAAGNNDDPDVTYTPPDTPPSHYPSSYDHVLSVANIQTSDFFWPGSLWGPDVDVSAPGVQSLSTVIGGGYQSASWSGTSMSSPVVAGIAGLLKTQHPEWLPDQVMNQIIFTTDDVSGIGNNQAFIDAGGIGSGRVNAYQAVNPVNQVKPRISINQIIVDDSQNGDNNNIPDPGETVKLIIGFENTWADVQNLQATLSTEETDIEVLNAVSTYPFILGASALGLNYATNAYQPFELRISNDAFPRTAVLRIDLASTGYSETFEVNLGVSSGILLVDDDDDTENHKIYENVLKDLGIGFSYWNHTIQGTPSAFEINHRTIIWVTNRDLPTLNSSDRNFLTYFLSTGGNLFITGQKIGYDLCESLVSGNEYRNSGGASRTFHETSLHANYITDNTSHSSVYGTAGDPIGDGFNFSIWQPGFGPNNQSSCEIRANGSAQPIFNYPNGRAAAVRYDGDHKVVYFAFGGIESIRDEVARKEVMGRVIGYLSGLTVDVENITDTEDTTRVFEVAANITSGSDIISVDMYWDTDGTFPYIKQQMTDMGAGRYISTIPAQKLGTTVEFFIVAVDDAGFYNAAEIYTFSVAPDTVPPAFSNATEIDNQLGNQGEYDVEVLASDNVGLDTNRVYLKYWSTSMPVDSVLMKMENGVYHAEIDATFEYGDSVYYVFSAEDTSMNRNRGESEKFSFVVGYEDFESGLDGWTTDGNSWGLETFRPRSGQYVIHESPGTGVVYPNNGDLTITYSDGLDFSELSNVSLSFWHFYGLFPNDIGIVEASDDGGASWQQVGNVVSGATADYTEETISLNDFAGKKNVSIRFRLTSDDFGAGPGWYIDDVRILPYVTGVAEAAENIETPDAFALYGNYPNPFNPGTWIKYALPLSDRVKLSVYNLLGQELRVLYDGPQESGTHRIYWDGKNAGGIDVPSGIYFYRLVTQDNMAVRKLTLIR